MQVLFLRIKVIDENEELFFKKFPPVLGVASETREVLAVISTGFLVLKKSLMLVCLFPAVGCREVELLKEGFVLRSVEGLRSLQLALTKWLLRLGGLL